MKKYFLLLPTLFFFINCFAQQNKIDSLENILKSEKEGSLKLSETYHNIAEEYHDNDNYSKTLEYYLKALNNLKENKNDSLIATYYYDIAMLHRGQKKINLAVEYFLKEINVLNKLLEKAKQKNLQADIEKYKIEIATVNSKIGNSYWENAEYKKAIEYHLTALKIYESLDYKKGIASTFNNISIVYDDLGNFDMAIDYQLKSIKTRDEFLKQPNPNIPAEEFRRNKGAEANSYFNIGIVYGKKGDVFLRSGDSLAAQTEFTKALDNSFKAKKIYEDYKFDGGVALACENIGSIYSKKNNYNKALEFLQIAININKRSDGYATKAQYAASLITLGEIYFKNNKLKEALENIKKSFSISEEIGDKKSLMNSADLLSKIYSAQGEYKAAYENHFLFSQIKDSVLNETTNKQIAEMQTKYETEKKDNEIELLNTKVQKQNLMKYASFTFAFLIIILSVVVFNNIKIRNRNKIFALRNETREEISRNLHDDVGSMLTAISMVCEKGKTLTTNSNAANELFDKAAIHSQNVSARLSELVWAINPQYDNLQSFLSYIRNYTSGFLDGSSIKYSIQFPELTDEIKLEPEVKHHLFFVVREALNNCVKHSQATQMEISFEIDGKKNYSLMIADNGKGFDMAAIPKHRNGLMNIGKRSEIINGNFTLHSEPDKGTKIIFRGRLS